MKKLKKSITVKNVCDMMNELLELDPKCINELMYTRIKCNKKIAEHPTVQVYFAAHKPTKVGLLGILNGLFGTREDGSGPICIEVEDNNNDKIIKFKPTPKKLEFNMRE
jgi:hypothetical protein